MTTTFLHHTKWMTVTGALLLGALLCASAQSFMPLSSEYWRNPEFVKNFMGSYGFDTDVEPRITAEEGKLFKDLVDQIQSNPSAAVATLRKSITADSSAALDFTLANINVQLGSLDEAARAYKEAIRKFPNFRRAHKNLAIVYVQQSKFRDAIGEFTRTIELGSEDGNTYGLLGYCYLGLEDNLSAESAYRSAILFAPDNTDWKLGLARSLLGQQQNKEAAALFEELIQKDPDKADYWLFQANAYLDLGELSKAADNYEIVRRMGKASGASLMSLGDIYISQDYKDLALDAYLASIEKDPTQDIKRPLRAAEILTNRQAWEEANRLLSQIKSRYAANLSGENRLKILKLESKVALASGDSAAATKTLEQIINEDPLDGEAMLILASYYGRTGQPEKAELLFDRAEKLKDYEANAYVQHAQMLVSQAKYDKAANLLMRAQQLRPRDNVQRYLEQVVRLAKAAAF